MIFKVKTIYKCVCIGCVYAFVYGWNLYPNL